MLKNLHEQKNLRLVIASSEAVPWSKTGGLGDVSTAVAKSLSELGHEVTLMIPYHRQTRFAQNHSDQIIESDVEFTVPVGDKNVSGRVCWCALADSKLRVILVDQPDYFDRPNLYQSEAGDYEDNCERFVFFSRAVLEISKLLLLKPDVIHANDWQTGLIPALLKIEYLGQPGFEQTASVFTIHNLAFQGWFWHFDMKLTGLDWKYFNWEQMESDGQVNLLKTGLAFCDQITTVSPTYAQEIQTPEYGCGLQGLLEHRSAELTGILNGIDPDEWNPRIDGRIPENYDVTDFAEKKPRCKSELQQKLGLPDKPDAPLFGLVSRLTDQKGFDLIAAKADVILQEDVQLAFLGSGESQYEELLRHLAEKYPYKVAVQIGFDERLAHEIEAGSDFYLMPSRFEPCGLNQMYSSTYGTIPLVRSTGGLADSVVNLSKETLKKGTATGVVFEEYDADDFLYAVFRCVELFHDRESLHQVIANGMNRDFSWQKSAREYLAVYQKAQQAVLAGKP